MLSVFATLILAAPAFSAFIIPRSDKEEYLQAHNDFRAQHGADPLTWSDEIASAAQDWADKCVLEHSGGPWGGQYQHIYHILFID